MLKAYYDKNLKKVVQPTSIFRVPLQPPPPIPILKKNVGKRDEGLLKRIEAAVRSETKPKKKKLYQPRSPLPRHQVRFQENENYDEDDEDEEDDEEEQPVLNSDVIRETYNQNADVPVVRVERDANNTSRLIGAAKIVVRDIPIFSSEYVDDGWGDFRRRTAYKPYKKRRRVVFIS